MFNPRYRILIKNKHFPRDKVICLGVQLISIVNSMSEFLPRHIWYGADVEAVGKCAMKHNLNDIKLNLIGSDSQFVKYCSGVEQFIWGVFLCVNINFSSQNMQDVELETEDEPFRSISCDGVLMEIRAFDTSYFEIYSEDVVLIKKISRTYHICSWEELGDNQKNMIQAYVGYELEHQHQHANSAFARAFNSTVHQIAQNIGGVSQYV